MLGMPLVGWAWSLLVILLGGVAFAKARLLNRLNAAGYRRMGLAGFARWIEANERRLVLWTRFGAVLMVLVGLLVILVVPDWGKLSAGKD